MLGFLLAAFLTGQSADLATTLHALHRSGFAEGNPALARLGTRGLVLVKGGYTAGVTVWALRARTRHPRVVGAALAIGASIGVAATIHNVRVLRR
jgi:hypothetical protein